VFNNRTWEEWEQAYRKVVGACIARLDALGLDRTAYGADVNAADPHFGFHGALDAQSVTASTADDHKAP
jgi:hypothetical protein